VDSGSPVITDSKMTFNSGDAVVSETWKLGSGKARILRDKYQVGHGAIDIQYKTGNTVALCESDIWHNINEGQAFISLGWVKIRVSVS
jgi:alpha-D-ribose 1-methylphosphonate 5-triphosphate synthase subunit PhnL